MLQISTVVVFRLHTALCSGFLRADANRAHGCVTHNV